jgi:hypothetical protein
LEKVIKIVLIDTLYGIMRGFLYLVNFYTRDQINLKKTNFLKTF